MAGLIVAAAVSLAWCLFAIWLGPRIGFLDRPGASSLKTHARPTVPLGGVGIFLGVHAGAATGDGIDLVLLAASGLVLVLGLVDDRIGLSPVIRLGVEVAAALLLVLGPADASRDPVTSALAVILVVLAINAVNLFDGLDGLVGSVGLVTALGIAWLSSTSGGPVEMPLQLAAALAGFLVVGWHPARIFLGDSGAYVVGLLLASAILDASGGDGWSLVAAASLLGVFALDLIVTLARRTINRRPLFEGDRSHLYDQLRDRGLSTPGVVWVATAAQTVIIVIAVGARNSLGSALTVLVMAVVLLLLVGVLRWAGFIGAQPG